jgi:hypothetical protein
MAVRQALAHASTATNVKTFGFDNVIAATLGEFDAVFPRTCSVRQTFGHPALPCEAPSCAVNALSANTVPSIVANDKSQRTDYDASA